MFYYLYLAALAALVPLVAYGSVKLDNRFPGILGM